ncbi:MAG: sensor histidine kinase [Alphaproteobacteria bacterium]|jgi:two-component system phosphate regulon sensor histidine kinase PhoR
MNSKNFSQRNIFSLFRYSLVILFPSVITLILLMIYGVITLQATITGIFIVVLLSIVYTYPYVIKLQKLTNYVNRLANDENATLPDLRFLNNVKELSEAITRLHKKWEEKENRLKLLVQEAQILIDSQPEIIILINSSNNILRINKTGENIFGKKLANKLAQNVLHYAQVIEMLDDFRNNKAGSAPVIFPLQAKHFSKFFLVNISRFPKTNDNLVKSAIDIIISLQDITAQVKNEQTLRDFIANASHELRTPVTTITTITETIKNIYLKDKKQTLEFLNLLEGQGERLKTLVNSLLSLSKVQSMNTNWQNIDLLSLVKSTLLRVEMLNPDRKNKMIFVSPESLPLIKGLESEITQVVENLLTNAIKYSPSKSEIRVVLSNLNEREIPKKYHTTFKHAISISVIDKGIGVAKEHLNRLTERFYRVSEASEIKGTGLGLSIVAKIVEKHNGKLEIKSKPNEGSTFTVYFPY